jgi:hypothetical protein
MHETSIQMPQGKAAFKESPPYEIVPAKSYKVHRLSQAVKVTFYSPYICSISNHGNHEPQSKSWLRAVDWFVCPLLFSLEFVFELKLRWLIRRERIPRRLHFEVPNRSKVMEVSTKFFYKGFPGAKNSTKMKVIPF